MKYFCDYIATNLNSELGQNVTGFHMMEDQVNLILKEMAAMGSNLSNFEERYYNINQCNSTKTEI